MSRVLNSVVSINSIGLLFLFIVILVVGVFEKPLISYPRLGFKVKSQHIHAGDAVEVEAYRCSRAHEPITYLLTHQLVDEDSDDVYILKGTQVEVPGISKKNPDGCSTATSTVNVMPKEAPKGHHYHFSGNAKVDGTIRNFNVPWYSETFISE